MDNYEGSSRVEMVEIRLILNTAQPIRDVIQKFPQPISSIYSKRFTNAKENVFYS